MSDNMHNQNMNRYETLSNAMSESEFPSLSESSTNKQRKTTNKRNVIKLVVPLKTYKDELREKYRQSFDQRAASENVKTRICNSLDKNEVCPHGEGCLFAHSLEELVIRDCHFNDKCRFVRIKSGKLVNDGESICRNKHSQESKDDFIRRTGLSRYNTTHEEIDIDDEEPKANFVCDRQTNYKCATEIKQHLEVAAPTVIEPVQAQVPTFKFGSSPYILPPAYGSPFMKFEGLRALNLSTNHPPATFKFGGTPPSLEKEIVLRVPKVLAIQAFELAINSGNRCIRVEVI